jgi:hypothetical protein
MRGEVFGMRLPGDGELALGDQLADAIADEVDAEDGAVGAPDDLHEPAVPRISLLPLPARLYSYVATASPCSARACASVRPTEATSGLE